MNIRTVKYRSPIWLLIIIASSIFIFKIALAFLLSFFPSLPFAIRTFLDAALLIILLLPILYFFLLRSLVSYAKQCDRSRAEIMDLARFPLEDPLPVLRIKKDGVILFSNAACHEFARVLRCEAGQLVTDPLHKLIIDAINSKEIKEFELKMEYKTVLLSVVPVAGSEYANIYGYDITGREQVMKDLKEATEIKSKFTSIASHELRNPLASLKEAISAVLEGLAGGINNKQKGLLEVAMNSINRLARLANEILDFQKLESGKMRFKMKQDNINKTIMEIYQTMLRLIEGKGLYFTLKLDENLPDIQYDKDKITDALTNLISNAVKFTQKGGIAVTAAQKDGAVHVAVQDTGSGIRAQDMPRLFRTFEQLENGKLDGEKGAGLGLAICKEIIEGHKGKIWAESEYGKGSTFHFTLPVN